MNEEQISREEVIAKKYAEVKGLKLNPDKEELKTVFKGLAENREEHGVPYCPCRVLEGDKKEDAKKICPCYWHLQEVERDGHCLCRLFFKK